MCPPSDGDRSTRMTCTPPSAMSSAACMPAMPPPITRAFLVSGTRIGESGALRCTLATIERMMSNGLDRRLFAIGVDPRALLAQVGALAQVRVQPAAATVLRNVFSCIRGEHAPTITPVSLYLGDGIANLRLARLRAAW